MKKQRKISFLIAAHNEEKIISKTLDSLLNFPYANYEVIIGLDGCTDNTEKIVKKYCKKSKKFKYYNLNLRQGKPAVIDSIIKKAKGEIIIINDADWIFKIKDKQSLKQFLSTFDDPKIGGIAESFPVEWDIKKLKNCNLGYKMVAYSSYFWLSYQKEKLTLLKNKKLYLKEPTMFLTNIFRKKLYQADFSLGDDFERTRNIMNKNYEIIIFPEEHMPRMIAVYSKIPVKDLFKQKVRTAIARKQLEKTGKLKADKKSYYIPATMYIFKNAWKKSISIGSMITFWIFIATLGTLIAKFKKIGTKKGWMMRINRQ